VAARSKAVAFESVVIRCSAAFAETRRPGQYVDIAPARPREQRRPPAREPRSMDHGLRVC